MKIIHHLLALSLILSIGCGGKSPRQMYEKTGGFSYDPPADWQVMEMPGLKYRISHGVPENGFAPNINVVDERFAGSLAEYVDANIKNMGAVLNNLNVLSREDFQTQDSLPMTRLVTENEQQDKTLRQTFFFIGPKNRKYVVTCTAPAASGDRFDTLFLNSVKTFRIH